MSISESYASAARKYQLSLVLFLISGIISGAALVFSLLVLEGDLVWWLLRVVLAIIALVSFFSTMVVYKQVKYCKNRAHEWSHL